MSFELRLGRFLVILLIGVLSVFYAEVLAGSSILWFLDPFGFIVLIPLYLFHLLLLINIAVRVNKLTSRSLYLFGVFFGLYETWMTKVAWTGFSGGESLFGSFLGFDIATFSIIVLFWHPFMSFIAPLVTFRVIMDYFGVEDPLFISGIEDFRTVKRRSWFFFYFFAFFAAGAMTLNSGYNILVSLSGILISLFLVFVLVKVVAKIDREALSFESLILGKKGLAFICAYLGVLYFLFFVGVRPEAVPGVLTILLTVLFYVFISLLIYMDKGGEELDVNSDREMFSFKHLLRFYVIIISLTVIFSLLGAVTFIVLVIMFLLAILLGYILFTNKIIKIFLRRIGKSP